MASARRDRMSSVDTAWLRMDRPSNLMMICGVLLFRERVTLTRLRRAVEQRFLRFRRFRQRALQLPTGAWWETDPAFDLSAHVVREKLAVEVQTPKASLEALVGRLMSEPLNPRRPLWQFHLVERYGKGSAVILRIHHCYADGIALIQVMLSMTDADREGKLAGPVPPPPRVRAGDDDPLSMLMEPLGGALKQAMKIGGTLVDQGVAIWRDPAKAVDLAGKGSALTSEIARLALMGADSPTRFKGKPGVVKRVAWADPLPLEEVKAVGRALDCSVNDVLLASVTGALRAYLRERGDAVEGAVIRALVPVNLRPAEKAWKLGNRFGLVFLDLPLGIENPVERVYAVRATMQSLKGSYQPLLAMGILAAMGAGPRLLQEQLLDVLAANATAVMTNVPGPQQTLYLSGAAIDAMMFWVPQSGDIGLGVSILSYAGSVRFGVVSDRKLCPDPDRVIDRFAPEFEKLLLATVLAPWPWDQPPAAADFETLLIA
jgi:WS/DGAT/MGAT family acyltransferase